MQPALKVSYVDTDALVPYAGNAKQHPAWQIEHIANSISQFGFSDPVGVWTNLDGELEIVEGHGRVLAAKELGIERIPIVKLDHLDDDARRAYAHVHNQTTLTSGFDFDTLRVEISELPDFDWDAFGFDIENLGIEQEDVVLENIVEDVPPETVEPRCKLGEVWQLGEHRVMCGSAIEGDDIEKLTGGGTTVQLLVTDPPYGVNYVGRTDDALTIMNDSLDDDGLFSFLLDAFKAAKGVMEPGAAFYIFHSDGKGGIFRNAVVSAGLKIHECLIWVKNSFVLGRQDYQWKHEPCLYGWKDGAHYFFDSRKESTVVEDERPNIAKMRKADMKRLLEEIYSDKTSTSVIHENRPSRNAEHPTMKPVKLIARLIRNSSKPGWIVLDPFGGSGSTLIACEQLGRKCLTMELDPHYCDVIIERWEQFTGEQAQLLTE